MCRKCDEALATLNRIVGNDDPKLPDPAPLPNALELEYAILSLFSDILATGTLTTQRYGSERVFSFPCAAGQRANIHIETVDMQYCTYCSEEMIQPEYNQNMHKKCREKYAQDVQLPQERDSAERTETPA